MGFVDWVDRCYSGVKGNKPWLVKLKYYSILRLTLRVFANASIPIYFKLTGGNRKYAIPTKSENPDLIVSMTTFPKRVNTIWLTIESILRQSQKPDRIILWLSKDYFKGTSDLPFSLQTLQRRGLEINFVEGDIRAHKKYYYALTRFPDSKIVMVDDDIIYPTTMIYDLIKYNQRYPNSIICHRALIINRIGKELMPYNRWTLCDKESDSRNDLFVTTGGGTLIHKSLFDLDIINLNLFKKLTLNSDDMWINCMARLNRVGIVKTDYYSDCLPVWISGNEELSTENVNYGLNDAILEGIRSYYTSKRGIDPYLF